MYKLLLLVIVFGAVFVHGHQAMASDDAPLLAELIKRKHGGQVRDFFKTNPVIRGASVQHSQPAQDYINKIRVGRAAARRHRFLKRRLSTLLH